MQPAALDVIEDQSADDHVVTSWGLVVEGFAAASQLLRDDLAAELGLPLAWMDVLLRLLRTPGNRLTMSELAAQALMTTSGFTRMADRLSRAGLVERQPCGTDRRVIRVALTPAGLELASRARDSHATHLRARVVDVLGVDDTAELARIMRTLRDRSRSDGKATTIDNDLPGLGEQICGEST